MTHFEAIRNLSPEQLEKFLDQVFLTGYNTGHQSVVDRELDDANPFDMEWLKSGTEKGHEALVEDSEGGGLIISPLAKVVIRMAEFGAESMPDDISWEGKILLPKGMGGEGEDDE